jgi:hypothetical protein
MKGFDFYHWGTAIWMKCLCSGDPGSEFLPGHFAILKAIFRVIPHFLYAYAKIVTQNWLWQLYCNTNAD